MKQLLQNRYLYIYLGIYVGTLVLMQMFLNYSVENSIAVLVIFGIGFSGLAYLLSRNIIPESTASKPFARNEMWGIVILLLWIILYLTVWKKDFNGLAGSNASLESVLNLVSKLFTFVVVPFLFYRFVYRFQPGEMGFTNNVRNLLKPRYILLFGVMTILILVFQLFAGNGAKPIRQGVYNLHQLSIAIPLGFIWLFFEVGLVEEFFYRVILQSRMKALTGSTLGGIVVSGLLFGLSHAPGMYLRGAGTLDGLGAEPSLLSAVGYSIVTLSCAGFFLGVIWERTRNLWLICAIHAVVDLLPFVPKFISLWSI